MAYPPLRRRDRQTDHSEARDILIRAPWAVLSLCGSDGQPYGVTLCMALYGDTLYFHCAASGHKLDLISVNAKCHVTAVAQAEILSETASVRYRSACVWGRVRIVTDAAERNRALAAITAKYMSGHSDAAARIIAKDGPRTVLGAVDIHHLTGKTNE